MWGQIKDISDMQSLKKFTSHVPNSQELLELLQENKG